MNSERPVFMSRDYGDREIPVGAEVISAGDEDDVTVWAWREAEDDELVFLQQGYDLIAIPLAALRVLATDNRNEQQEAQR